MSSTEVDLRTQQAIDNFLDELASRISDIVGAIEVITGCAITNVDSYGTGAMPRYITARVNEFTEPNILWRGVPPSLTVGMEVSVLHLREGNRYEVLGASGAGGITSSLELYDENPPPATPPSATGAASVAIGDRAIASGDFASTGGGVYNTAGGRCSHVGGGYYNSALGSVTAIAGGVYNLAGGDRAFIGGGVYNQVSSNYGVVGGGYYNLASGNFSAILGGRQAVANKYGQQAHSAGRFSQDGDAQRSVLLQRIQTNNNVQTEMFLDGTAARCTIATDTTWLFRVEVVARRTDADNESAGWVFWGVIDNNAGTTALAGDGVFSQPFVSKDVAAWDVDVDADDANDALRIRVTGENAKTINWVGVIYLSPEVTG